MSIAVALTRDLSRPVVAEQDTPMTISVTNLGTSPVSLEALKITEIGACKVRQPRVTVAGAAPGVYRIIGAGETASFLASVVFHSAYALGGRGAPNISQVPSSYRLMAYARTSDGSQDTGALNVQVMTAGTVRKPIDYGGAMFLAEGRNSTNFLTQFI